MVDKSRPPRRRTTGPRKGDVREQDILDATEKLLATRGYQDMTVNDIAGGRQHNPRRALLLLRIETRRGHRARRTNGTRPTREGKCRKK
jgi:hypothetical protein